ncbi:MAG: hypothetical protein AAFZ63_28445 [Bacteroidota bacterium]
MRLTILLISIAFLLHSCQVYQSYQDESRNALTDLSFPAHDNDIELFFAGESVPQEDYIRLSIIKASHLSRTTAPGRLLEGMKKRAQQVGADAIIIMGAQDTEAMPFSSEGTAASIPRERMWGLAIRYINNLEEAENVLTHLTIIPGGEIASMPETMVDFNNTGVPNEKGMNKWARFVYHHSLEYLVDATSGWEYTTVIPTFGYQQSIVRRKLSRADNIIAKTKVNYRNNGQVTNLEVSSLEGRFEQIDMDITYDEKGRILSREWSDATTKSYLTKRYYSADGLLLREDIERQRPDDSFRPFLSVQYNYLSGEDLRARISQEQIVRAAP